jgi:hypothetical protein
MFSPVVFQVWIQMCPSNPKAGTREVVTSAFNKLGRSSKALKQWGAAVEVISGVANGLSDRELREGFLNAEPIREILSKAES